MFLSFSAKEPSSCPQLGTRTWFLKTKCRYYSDFEWNNVLVPRQIITATPFYIHLHCTKNLSIQSKSHTDINLFIPDQNKVFILDLI